ncbi:MAG: hypothetical protein ACOX3U_04690 [Christensenellales bacterium]|jgi:molecular chaperone DnaJ
MTYNPYEILEVNEQWPLDEITKKYLQKKSELTNLLFSEGRTGSDAAEKLQQIKEAYEDIKYIKNADAGIYGENDVRPLGRIEELVKQNNLTEAQKLLDAQTERGAEWHYIQAALYYKQGWIMESKKQLELAIKQAPNEDKYHKALKSLMNVINFGHPDGPQIPGNTGRSYQEPSEDAGTTCCKICGALMIADCCCDCLCR